MITCLIRYTVDMDKVAAFEHYARVWMFLIEKYGGKHYGYFMPGDPPPLASFSFPGIGERGPDNIAIALFTFPAIEAYESYRIEVSKDPQCVAVETLRTNKMFH